MMSWLIALLVLLILGAAVLFSGGSLHKRKTRLDYLEELTDFLQGALEPIEDPGYKDSYRVRFKFKEEDFVFEDIVGVGFKDKIYKYYLKVKTPYNLTLTFAEKKRSLRIRTDIFIASEVSTRQVDQKVRLQLPDFLKDLLVSTNDAAQANKFFEDKKVSAIMKSFKHIDTRAYPYISLSIMDGLISLEFHADKTLKPNITDIWINIPSIEDYLEKIIVLVKKLKEVATDAP
jgi:hypothetical protein